MSEKEKPAVPFSQHLSYLSKGAIDAEATEILAKVIKAVRETGKAGSITVTLKCSMLNTRDENTMKITPDIKFNVPALERGDTIMFSTYDGDLLRDDPDQVQMDLRVVNTAPAVAPIKLQQNG